MSRRDSEPEPTSAPPRRPRKPGHVRREQVLAAARVEFTTTGFAGTTIRQIAAAADVNDAMLYRLFATKEQLFEESVAAPLERAIRASAVPVSEYAGVRRVSERFMADLMRSMREVTPLLTAVLSDYERGSHFYRERFQPALSDLTSVAETNLELWEHRQFDPQLLIRVAIGICWFLALDERFGDRPALDAEVLGPELLSVIFDGLRAREDSDGGQPGAD